MKARLVWLILCGIWGSTWLFIKLGLADLPPITFAGVRFVISCAILFPLVWLRRLGAPKTRSEWFLVVGTGVMSFSLNYGLVFWAEQYITSGLAALLQATLPAFGLILAHIYVPTERITGVKIAGKSFDIRLWRLRPQRLYYLDNARGFSLREELSL